MGMARWWATAQGYLEAARGACAANRAPVELCAELRGKLSALVAKAQARGVAQDPPLGGIAAQASEVLQAAADSGGQGRSVGCSVRDAACAARRLLSQSGGASASVCFTA